LLDRPKPIKLFCGLIGSQEAVARARALLVVNFGEIDGESPLLDFTFTDYYTAEMGECLLRKWISFGTLRERAYLATAKHKARMLEHDLSQDGRRSVNIDPGYVDDAQVVLSTAKNYSHRIYIGAGCYAEATLVFERKVFKFLDWTYPDYRTPEALRFFTAARDAYMTQLRRRASGGTG
jgi:hypothetical protein